MDLFVVLVRASGVSFLVGSGSVVRMVPSRTVWLLANKTKAVVKTAASFDGGEV